MLQNAYFLAKIGADTAENEQHFAEILPTDALWLASNGNSKNLDADSTPNGRSTTTGRLLFELGGRGERPPAERSC